MPRLSRPQATVLLCAAASLISTVHSAHADEPALKTALVEQGNLRVLLRDNSQSPQVLSGVDSLFHLRAAPDFDAFDPHPDGASAGLNFEHVISGRKNAANMFTPRHGRYELFRLADSGGQLVRRAEDDPWKLASSFSYRVVAPHYIDIDFRCTPTDAALFGSRGYAVLFFANYMNDVDDIKLNFRGITADGGAEQWVAVDAPAGHTDYNSGGTYRHRDACPLEYDGDHNFRLNLWSYDNPRFTQPFYFGRAARGMSLIMMFDRTHSADDEIRFSLFKFKVPKAPRPAWDWQYVIHKVVADRQYGFRARLVWKPYVSPEDCLAEYQRWKNVLERSEEQR